jgi:hypothetical protein
VAAEDLDMTWQRHLVSQRSDELILWWSPFFVFQWVEKLSKHVFAGNSLAACALYI